MDLTNHILSDSEIVSLYWERDEKAIFYTQNQYGGLCKAISGRILRDPRDVEECLNDMLVATWNTIPPQKPNSLKLYICKLIRRISLNRVAYNDAHKRDARKTISFEEIESDLQNAFSDQHDFTDQDELTELLNRYLSQISEKKRVVLVLRFWHCMSIEEIAQKTDININTVKAILSRELRAMKVYFEKNGGFL